MAPKEKRTKAQIAAAAAAGGKGKKKKWSKGKQKDKLNLAVTFDKATYDRIYAEVPKMKLITPSVVSDRIRVNVSLARLALRELEAKRLIKAVGTPNSALRIYTRATGADDDAK